MKPGDSSPVTSARRRRRHARRQSVSMRSLLVLFLRTASWIGIFVGLGLGLYLTLRPSGDFSTIWWIPKRIERWADYYGRLRNVPAFALLAVPFLIIANGRRARRKAIYWLAAFCAITEAAQYFIPNRWCEWQDVACGWAGLAFTWGLFEAGFWGAWRVRLYFKGRKSAGVVPPVAQPVGLPKGGA